MGSASRLHIKQEVSPKGDPSLLTHTRSRVERCGFDSFMFRITSQPGNIQKDRRMITNHPNEFVSTFDNSCFDNINPIENHFKNSIDPLVWDPQLFSDAPALKEISLSYGLNYGWSLSAQDAKGTISILTLTRRSSPVSSQEFNDKVGDLLWLCHQLHMAMYETCLVNTKIDAPVSLLSQREAEILKWTAKGKTASDIAMILSLTPRTVNFHISSAMRKMGATNKTSAVVMAAKCGLL